MEKKKPRVDGQVTALAGEFFVAAELLKRGLQTSITFGNAKAIDLLAYNPVTHKNFTVQVKALRKRNYFLIGLSKIDQAHIYIFVLLNKPDVPVEYFVVPGKEFSKDTKRFGKDFTHPTFPGIHPRDLEEFRENWKVFDTTDEG